MTIRFYHIIVSAMSGEIKTFFLGRECRKCEDQGVRCVQGGLFRLGDAGTGQVAIYVDGEAGLLIRGGIDECPIITGKCGKDEQVARIKEWFNKAKSIVPINIFGNN